MSEGIIHGVCFWFPPSPQPHARTLSLSLPPPIKIHTIKCKCSKQLHALNSHLHFNSWVGIIVFDLKIFYFKVIDVFNFTKNSEFWERSRFSLELKFKNKSIVQPVLYNNIKPKSRW